MPALTWNTSYTESAGRRTYDVRGKWINSRNSSGVWAPLSLDFSGRVAANGLFSFEAPALATGRATFASDVNWHVGLKSNITAPAYEISIDAVGVSPVECVVDGSIATYAGAYGQHGDLIYQVRRGRAPRLEKLVRWNQEPSGDGDVRVSFDLHFPTVEITTQDGPLPEDVEAVAEKLQAWRDAVAANASIPAITQAEIDYRWWLLQYEWQGSKQSAVSLMAGAEGDNRGATIQPAYVWDSAGNRQQITLELEPTLTGMRLTKVVPRSFLSAATYPVYTDATTTVYPNANPETTSCDGRAYRNGVSENWATIRAGAGTGATDTNTSVAGVVATATSTTNLWSQIIRSFFLFDTSAIDDAYYIWSATLTITKASSSGSLSGAAIGVVSSTPASNTGLVAADFSQVGTTLLAPSIATGSFAAGANTFTLSSSGRAAISKTGVTKFGLREANYDAAGTTPTWSSLVEYAAVLNYADTAGTGSDPVLVVESYDTPPVDPAAQNLLLLGVG